MGAAIGLRVPDMRLHADAARVRAEMRHTLSAFLDLTVIALAGGAGVDQALTDAAGAGHGPAFARLRQTLATARLLRTSPWPALTELGGRLTVEELVELASSVQLAGAEGAKVRASLAAKASALRGREQGEAEREANAATERMSLPVVLLFAGFLLFLGYPALANVLAGM
jgi:Flp pilus assembly protein TadB